MHGTVTVHWWARRAVGVASLLLTSPTGRISGDGEATAAVAACHRARDSWGSVDNAGVSGAAHDGTVAPGRSGEVSIQRQKIKNKKREKKKLAEGGRGPPAAPRGRPSVL